MYVNAGAHSIDADEEAIGALSFIFMDGITFINILIA
jgi:hypothetical protein